MPTLHVAHGPHCCVCAIARTRVCGMQAHQEAAAARFGAGIDFKLAANPWGARNAATQRETGFAQLSVKMCKVRCGEVERARACWP